MPPGAGPLTGFWKDGKGRDGKPKRWWYSKDASAYARASYATSALDSKDGLVDWAACQAAVGMMLSPSCRSEVATLINEYGDPWYNGDDGTAIDGKTRLKKAVEKARDTAGQSTASSAGTEFHKLGELVNKGIEPRIVQDHLVEYLEQYKEAVAPINFLAQEILIVNDILKRAGSVDYLMELPAGLTTPDGVIHEDPMVVVGDLKTGKWDAQRPLHVTGQLTVYGTGYRYEQEHNVRLQLHPRINTDWGLMVHFPIMKKNPEVKFYWIDLQLGLEAAKLANQVEAMTKRFQRKETDLEELKIA